MSTLSTIDCAFQPRFVLKLLARVRLSWLDSSRAVTQDIGREG